MRKILKRFSNIFMITSCVMSVAFNINVEAVQPKTPINIQVESADSRDIISISEYSTEFMSEYFNETNDLNQNDKENILIVTSKEEIKDTFGATEIVEGPNNQYFLQYDSKYAKDNAFGNLNESDEIINVEENVIHKICTYNSWGVEETGLDYAKEIANNKDLNEITVAIIDTGCDIDLFNSCYPGRLAGTYNAINNDAAMTDENGHGTHIAGTIAESTPDNVKILPIKVSDASGSIFLADIIEAINYVVYYDKADVINMSYGSYTFTDSEYNAIELANQENIICVAAAGNDNINDTHYPSAFDNTISIASVDSRLEKSDFSNYGSSITFCAPGSNILSINGLLSGTSMATPHAVAAVAILKSYNENISLDDTITLLKQNAIDLGDVGYDEYYGYGLINFNDIGFYDGISGDKYNIFGNTSPITKIELAEEFSPTYNYGNITNIMNAKINIYYGNTNYATRCIGELDNFEITGYDPYSYTSQNVTLKYSGKTTTFTINNTNAKNAGWGYTSLGNNNISLTEIHYSTIPPVKIYIPEALNGYTVTRIDDYLFYEVTNIKSVVLTDTIQTIGEAAFYYSTNLRNIEFSNGLDTIDDYAFGYCYNLSEIDIPSSTRIIGNYTFYNCTNLKNIDLKDGLQFIGSVAFSSVMIKNMYIPKTVSIIGVNPFLYTTSLEIITGSAENPYYKIQNNSIVELSDGSLVCTIETIPNDIKKINTYAFINSLEEVYIPEGVIEIENWAFNNFDYASFKKIYLPKSLTKINENSFLVYVYYYNDEYYDADLYPKYLTLYVYNNSEAHSYAKNEGKKYLCLDPNEIIVNGVESEYYIWDKIDVSNLSLELKYEDGRTENINNGIEVNYNNGTGFTEGDTYFTVSTYNEYGIYVEKNVNVTLKKFTPTYTIPTNLEATRWQSLSEISLPECFSWMDETEILKDVGNVVCKAKYTPKDTDNYETIENIDITINVKHVELPFKDVYSSDWFYPAIEFVYGKGYILGTSNTTFEPRTKLTRGMIVTILFRIEGANEVSGNFDFPDVSNTEYYYEAVRWAKANKVVNGYQDGYFRPNNHITREELACILMNYSDYKGENINLTTDLSRFNDANSVSDFAKVGMEWAVARGVITGYDDDNTLRPQGTTTRDIAAVMICKYFTNNKQQ